jgi:hypothetical protein
MFKFFLLAAVISVSFVLYYTYIKSDNKTVSLAISDGESIIYTKSYCPYCVKAKNLLTTIKITYKEISLD